MIPMDKNLSTRDFYYFKTIADEKSITRASRKLFIAQPSLSHAARTIEEKAGVPLFRRSVSGVTLTVAGEKFYSLALRVLKSVDNFSFEVSDLSELRSGEVHFGVTRHLGTLLLPEVVPEFHERYPGIRLYITEETSTLQEENLLNGQIDFSLMHVPLKPELNPAIHYESLNTDPFMVILPRSSKLQPKVRKGAEYPTLDVKLLRDETFIMTKKGQRIRQISDRILEKADIYQPHALIETASIATLMRLVAVGAGVGILPRGYLKLETPGNPPYTVCAIPKKYGAAWTSCIATVHDPYLSRADLALLDIIRARISAEKHPDEEAIPDSGKEIPASKMKKGEKP